jgi:hypothetical protein
MKLTSTLSLALLMCLPLIFACKKSSGPTEKPVVLKKVLNRIIKVNNDNKTSFTTFSYDEKLRLKSVSNGTTTDVYRYDGENVSYTEFWVETNKNENTMSYLNGKLNKILMKSYNTGVLARETTIGYIYGSGPLPTEMHATEGAIVRAVDKYQYSANNNIIRTENQTNVLIIVENTYDTNKNKFSNCMLDFVLSTEPYDRLSPNNILKRKIIYPDGSYLEITNTYTYDAEGFPVTQVSKAVHSSSGDSGTEKYTYEYVLI